MVSLKREAALNAVAHTSKFIIYSQHVIAGLQVLRHPAQHLLDHSRGVLLQINRNRRNQRIAPLESAACSGTLQGTGATLTQHLVQDGRSALREYTGRARAGQGGC